jgi:hypothetical protein
MQLSGELDARYGDEGVGPTAWADAERGAEERKAHNLKGNPHCALTTGANTLNEGLDLVLEGEATRITETERLAQLARAYVTKYGPDWTFEVRDGAFVGPEGNAALVFGVPASRVYAFGKGEFSQTRFIGGSST